MPSPFQSPPRSASLHWLSHRPFHTFPHYFAVCYNQALCISNSSCTSPAPSSGSPSNLSRPLSTPHHTSLTGSHHLILHISAHKSVLPRGFPGLLFRVDPPYYSFSASCLFPSSPAHSSSLPAPSSRHATAKPLPSSPSCPVFCKHFSYLTNESGDRYHLEMKRIIVNLSSVTQTAFF